MMQLTIDGGEVDLLEMFPPKPQEFKRMNNYSKGTERKKKNAKNVFSSVKGNIGLIPLK